MQFITSKQAAELLQVSNRTLLRWEYAGLIKCFRSPTGRRRYQQSELIAFFNDKKNKLETIYGHSVENSSTQ